MQLFKIQIKKQCLHAGFKTIKLQIFIKSILYSTLCLTKPFAIAKKKTTKKSLNNIIRERIYYCVTTYPIKLMTFL